MIKTPTWECEEGNPLESHLIEIISFLFDFGMIRVNYGRELIGYIYDMIEIISAQELKLTKNQDIFSDIRKIEEMNKNQVNKQQ